METSEQDGRGAPSTERTDGAAEATAERLLTATLGAYEVLAVYVGERLGWFDALAEGPATPAVLAERTRTDERYVREWLELQATYGILTAEEVDGGYEYTLPAGAREALTDRQSLAYVGALPRLVAASAAHLPRLLEAYRTGDGIGWAELGGDGYEAQAALNRPWFERRLAPALAEVPAVHAALSRPGARVADVGCGGGWSTIALARAYPEALVEGWDVDAASIDLARRNAAESGAADLVRFRHAGAEDLDGDGPLDVAFLLECLHDMPRPVEVLGTLRRALDDDGVVVVMDEAVGDVPSFPGDEVERLMYGFSLFVCLPDGRASRPSAATGTVLRRPLLERYAQEAGFSRVEVLPIEDFGFFRFYALRP